MILIVGDPHFKPSTVKETDALYQLTESYVAKYRPSAIVVLGDVLDRHAKIDMKQQHDAINYITMLAGYSPTYVLVGNHDIAHNSDYLPSINSLSAMKLIRGVVLVERPIRRSIAGLDCVLAPFVPNGRLHEALSNSMNSGTVLFCHQEFKGAFLSPVSNAVSDTGDTIQDLNFKLIISGHIHQASEFTVNKTKVIYAGTPYQISFAEKEDKHLLLLRPEQLEHKELPLHIRPKRTIKCSISELGPMLESIRANPTKRSELPQYRLQVEARIEDLDTSIAYKNRTYSLRYLLKRRILKNTRVELLLPESQSEVVLYNAQTSSIDFIGELRNVLNNEHELLALLDSY